MAGALWDLAALRRRFPGNPHFALAAAKLVADGGDLGGARRLAAEAVAAQPLAACLQVRQHMAMEGCFLPAASRQARGAFYKEGFGRQRCHMACADCCCQLLGAQPCLEARRESRQGQLRVQALVACCC